MERIIGYGDGAEQSHYSHPPEGLISRRIIPGKDNFKLCKECMGNIVFGKKRYCEDCQRKRRNEAQKRWRNKNTK